MSGYQRNPINLTRNQQIALAAGGGLVAGLLVYLVWPKGTTSTTITNPPPSPTPTPTPTPAPSPGTGGCPPGQEKFPPVVGPCVPKCGPGTVRDGITGQCVLPIPLPPPSQPPPTPTPNPITIPVYLPYNWYQGDPLSGITLHVGQQINFILKAHTPMWIVKGPTPLNILGTIQTKTYPNGDQTFSAVAIAAGSVALTISELGQAPQQFFTIYMTVLA